MDYPPPVRGSRNNSATNITMATHKQISANKKNALCSTGPRTSAGKARSSRNALKHGAYGKNFLTPDETDAELDQILKMLQEHYKPETKFKEFLVLQLAEVEWQLARYFRIEVEILISHGYEKDDPERDRGDGRYHFEGAGWGLTHDCTKARSLAVLSQIMDRTFRRREKMKKYLDQILPAKPPGILDAISDVAPLSVDTATAEVGTCI